MWFLFLFQTRDFIINIKTRRDIEANSFFSLFCKYNVKLFLRFGVFPNTFMAIEKISQNVDDFITIIDLYQLLYIYIGTTTKVMN